MDISLRPADAEDHAFLYELYCSTRLEELAAWGWDATQAAAFLQLQFRAQQLHYQTQFSHASHEIICHAGQPIGRLILDSSDQELRLVDIALLPAYRNSGIGTALLRDVLAAAARMGRPVRLHVAAHNRARRLYERLGFTLISTVGPYDLMEKAPSAVAAILTSQPKED
jgi:ribosomal protein S18 acetylase RimI-like enzyme